VEQGGWLDSVIVTVSSRFLHCFFTRFLHGFFTVSSRFLHGFLTIGFFPGGSVAAVPLSPFPPSSPPPCQFHPLKRIEPFNEEVRMSVAGSERKLLSVTGSCQAIEVSLGADALPFGKQGGAKRVQRGCKEGARGCKGTCAVQCNNATMH
jgi:hypothetical protein